MDFSRLTNAAAIVVPQKGQATLDPTRGWVVSCFTRRKQQYVNMDGRNMQKRTLKPTIQVLTYLKEGLNSWPTCEMTYKWQRWISTYLFQYHKHQENSKSFAIWQEGRSCATWQRLKFKKECIIQYKKAWFSSCFIYKSHRAYTKYLLT